MKSTKLITTLGVLALAGAVAYKASKRHRNVGSWNPGVPIDDSEREQFEILFRRIISDSSDTDKSKLTSNENTGRHWVDGTQVIDKL